MNIIITGAGGFVGSQLLKELCKRGEINLKPEGIVSISSILAVDLKIPTSVREGLPSYVSFIEGDISTESVISQIIPDEDFLLFHLAAMVSGDGEKNFDLCMEVNFEGTRRLFEACRHSIGKSKVVFASSLAIYGGEHCPSIIEDQVKPLPQTTYGMTKLMGELMINEYSRKGFFDGRAVRLPTIFIRPGKPNAALSSFASGLFREPLNGIDFELPVSRGQLVPLLSYRKVIEAFILAMECDATLLKEDRSMTLPSKQYLVSEMIESLENFASAKGMSIGKIIDAPDPVVMKVVEGWPVGTDAKAAEAIGVRADNCLEDVLDAYVDDFVEC
ncbi:MAG: NAD-dependent epimerase/dehydratase family protein [Lentisphaeraceae bacterium]|nr:NAD-dependent epimerase/dehydratase family protein [Lentisphaeraceae bacterium]